MASYKQPSVHCGTLVDRDVWFYLSCGVKVPSDTGVPPASYPSEKVRHSVPAAAGRFTWPVRTTENKRLYRKNANTAAKA